MTQPNEPFLSGGMRTILAGLIGATFALVIWLIIAAAIFVSNRGLTTVCP